MPHGNSTIEGPGMGQMPPETGSLRRPRCGQGVGNPRGWGRTRRTITTLSREGWIGKDHPAGGELGK